MLTGSLRYTLGNAPVIGLGISFAQEELDLALAGPVAEIVFDTEETSRLTALIESAPGTDFDPESIQRILKPINTPENWRVGEALAESYLIEKHGCHFPWPDGRDERKSGSSLPGADLVGFHQQSGEYRFVFGEVKTSSDGDYPPGTTYGRTGFKKQIEDLKEKQTIRDGLVKYLAHRATNATWLDRFKVAVKRYITNSKDVQIFGILVRDVPPHQNDLRTRTEMLGRDCPDLMSIHLCALYLPQNSIPSLSATVMRARRQGGTI